MKKRLIAILIVMCAALGVLTYNAAADTAANTMTATEEISFWSDIKQIQISAYDISDENYIDHNEVAETSDSNTIWSSTEEENDMEIDTTPPYTESEATEEEIIEEETIEGIDPSKPMIALTFDDGPSDVTEQILDALEQHGAVATFYVVGNLVERHRDIVSRAFMMGNEIANHSWSHPFLTKLSEEAIRTQLQDTNDAIEAVTGTAPVTMRPPYGDVNQRALGVITDMGLPVILWSVDPWDWRYRDADHIYEYVMENAEDRDIVLMHDLYESTAEAAIRLIPALIAEGFQLVTVTELMYYSGITLEPGIEYKSGIVISE